MRNNYLNERIIIENDVIILFALFRNSKSFQYIDELGYYYYIGNNNSISNTLCDPIKSNEIIHSIYFIIIFFKKKYNIFFCYNPIIFINYCFKFNLVKYTNI